VLAFRRALALEPSVARARTNLAWLEGRMASWVPVPQAGAFDSLGSWARSRSRPARSLAAALAFALAFGLFFAGAERWRAARTLALLTALLWLGLGVSVLVERDESRDAVVIRDGAVLRAADSAGAPAVLSQPLPAGAEVVLRESREGWSRVELASGTSGWLQESALALVAPSPRSVHREGTEGAEAR
jgi:hypothetical protein